MDVLADLHAIEPKEVGLENLGKSDSYVGRQLKTWYRSWTSSIESANYDDPRAKELQEFFVEHKHVLYAQEIYLLLKID